MSKTSNNLMSPMHISKLDHEIEEIRNRALKSIESKYKLKLVDEANVGNNKYLVEKLLKLFNFEKGPDEDKALRILLHVAKTENFDKVVNDLDGDWLLNQLNNVEKKTEGRHLPVISEIKDLVLGAKRKQTKPIITELVIQNENHKDEYKDDDKQEMFNLPWQSLSKADKQILDTTYEGLRYLDNTSAIMLACQFINDVILQDFPAEVFLQRPLVIHTLFELVNSRLISNPTPILKSILEILNRLMMRIKQLKDPNVKGSRWENANQKQDYNLDIRDTEELQKFHLSIYGFSQLVFDKICPILKDPTNEQDKNLAVCLILGCVMLQTNVSNPIPKIFEDILMKEKCKHVYFTLLTSMIIWLQKTTDLSMEMKNEIFKNVGDPALLYFFPELHDLLINLITELKEDCLIKDFDECLKICKAMDAAKKLEDVNLKLEDYFENLKKSLPSFEFHKNTQIIEDFIKKCGNRLEGNLKEMRTEILIEFLARDDVQEFAYTSLQHFIMKCIDNETWERLNFLNVENVWKELWMYGANSSNLQVQKTTHDILITILNTQKKIFLNSLQPVFALMSAYVNCNTPLARSILRIFEPTASKIPKTEIILGNLRLLFSKEIDINEEGFARLCWILAQDDPDGQKLPKMSDIKGLHLSSMCVTVKPPLPKPAKFSTNRSLNETMSALKSPGLTANDRRHLLEKLSVILEDVGLHEDFLELFGLDPVLMLLNKALVEDDLTVYPTSVFALISIFYNLAVNHATVRQDLATNDLFILNALRSLLLFTADEVFRQNAVGLLFLLTYCNHIMQVSSKIVIPEIIAKNVHVPINVHSANSNTHFKSATNRLCLMGNPNLSRTLRVHWAILWMGNIDAVTALNPEDLSKDIFSPNIPTDLMLTANDLKDLQTTDPRCALRLEMSRISKANSHSSVSDGIQRIISNLTWLEISKALPMHQRHDIDSLPWKVIFERFLTTCPQTMEDELLLTQLVCLLRCLLRATDNPDLHVWIRDLLTSPNGVFVELLRSLGKSTHGNSGRELRYSVIRLAVQFIQAEICLDPEPWIVLANVVNEYLETNLADHLDCFLSLLANITGAWTWDYMPHKELYKSLVTKVIEVISSFQKITDSHDSFMGSNIINNSLLILGHMLSDAAENIDGWEEDWEEAMRQAAGVDLFHADYSWLLTLISYRDPITRASAITLLSGLFTSPKAYNLLVNCLDMGMGNIWATALAIITDKNECALVKERAAVLLERLTTMGSQTDCCDFLDYIKNEGIYDKVAEIIELKNKGSEASTTNYLIAALSNWIFAVLELNKNVVAQHVAESSLMSSLIRISDRNAEKDNWIGMNSAVIRLLRACVKASSKVRDILLSSNFVQYAISLLTSSGDENSGLRILWMEIYYLLAVVLETEKGVQVFEKSLPCDKQKFFENISNAILLPITRQRVLALIHNLATPQLRNSFSPFGKNICENILSVDLTKCAETLSSVFLVCPEAQTHALERGGCQTIVTKIRKLGTILGKNIVDDYRKPSVKKKLSPILNEIESLYQLLTNFCFKNSAVKSKFAEIGLPDCVHKLWPWYAVSFKLRKTTLKMLCTFSYHSEAASQAIALTSPPNGLRKGTLIQSITQLITKEMEIMTQVRDKGDLSYSLQILSNCCVALECRVALAKGTILEPILKLLPSENKKRSFGDEIVEIWLHFINAFTAHPEGQLCVSKDVTTMELIFFMASSQNRQISQTSLNIILHLAMHPQNRCRLLNKPAPLLTLLINSLKSENEEMIRIAAATLWALAANSQKAKILIRSAGCMEILQQALQFCDRSDSINILERSLTVLAEK